MDSEGKFWFGIWALVLIGCIVFFSMILVDSIITMRTIDNMVSNGANPQDAACAVKTTERNCVLAGRK